jgi:hypothetical protein
MQGLLPIRVISGFCEKFCESESVGGLTAAVRRLDCLGSGLPAARGPGKISTRPNFYIR